MEEIRKEAAGFTSRPTLAIVTTMILLIAMTILLTYINVNNNEGSITQANASIAISSTPVAVDLPDFTALVKQEGPAVVNISTIKKTRGSAKLPVFPGLAQDDPLFEFFRRFSPGDQPPREFVSQSLGSGFIVSADGYILTNAHVVEDADEVTARLTDQREFNAKVIGRDKRSDIALLKIAAKNLPTVRVGNSTTMEVGAWVVAIGSPFGFSNSVSQGIVSAKGRTLPGENIIPFIQTDVPINPGNSGGPLFNMEGEVVAVNSQIYSRSGGYRGLSFAIPIGFAMKVKEELLKHGTVRRGALGVTVQDVSPKHARAFRLEKASGALIAAVDKGGPADLAGIRIGDIVLKFDGRDLVSADDLVRRVADAAPGSNAALKVWRDAASREIPVKLGKLESKPMAQKSRLPVAQPGRLGMNLRELSREQRQALHTKGTQLVEAVAGVAAVSGIQPGDIIVAINSQRVSRIGQFVAALNRAGKQAALLVQREGNMIFIPLDFSGG